MKDWNLGSADKVRFPTAAYGQQKPQQIWQKQLGKKKILTRI